MFWQVHLFTQPKSSIRAGQELHMGSAEPKMNSWGGVCKRKNEMASKFSTLRETRAVISCAGWAKGNVHRGQEPPTHTHTHTHCSSVMAKSRISYPRPVDN